MKQLESRLRLGSGIVLALYVAQHLVNHAFGIVSIEAAEAYRKTVGAVFQTAPGLVLLYGSILLHMIVALRSIYRRSSLRLSFWQWLQILMGLSIPPLVVGHAVANRGFALIGEVDPNYYYVVTSISLKPVFLVKLVILIAIIWIHMLIGLHFWLRIKRGYHRYLPYAYALAVLIPALAYAGIYRMLVQASAWLDDSSRLDEIYAAVIAMDPRDVDMLRSLEASSCWCWRRVNSGSGGWRVTVLTGLRIAMAVTSGPCPERHCSRPCATRVSRMPRSAVDGRVVPPVG